MGAAKVKKENRTYPAQTLKAAAQLVPHYTSKSVIALFDSSDPRIRMNDYETSKSIQLSDEPGYFLYSDKNGGTATFYVWSVAGPIFTASVVITDEMRAAKCTAPGCGSGCGSDWTQIVDDCSCEAHHKDQHYDVIPRIEVCDDRHVHLAGQCYECFNSDLIDGKDLKDIGADNIQLMLR
jgi:hypothetical protein